MVFLEEKYKNTLHNIFQAPVILFLTRYPKWNRKSVGCVKETMITPGEVPHI